MYRNGCVGLLLVCLSCARGASVGEATAVARTLDTADIEVVGLSRRAIRLPRVVAIPEADFGRLLSEGRFAAPRRADVAELLSYASAANSPDALGLTGRLVSTATVNSEDLVVVMENPASTPSGVHQATKYHFASIQVAGTAAFALVDVSLHFNTDTAPLVDCKSWRGCRPAPASTTPLRWAHDSEGGAGLPTGTLFDAEVDGQPASAAGNTVELRVYSGADVDVPAVNRFVCAGEVAVDACSETPGQSILEAAQGFEDVAEAAVVTEGDFQTWLRTGQLKRRPPKFGAQAALTSLKLNHPSALGVVSTLLQGTATVQQLIVVRRPFIDVGAGRLESDVAFVVPGPFTLPKTLFGTRPRIAFDGPVPRGPWTGGVCGPVLVPGGGFVPEWLGDFPFSPAQALYGTDRYALRKPRATVRFPFSLNSESEVHTLACSIYQPPKPPLKPTCVDGVDPLTGKFIREECNGVDDNCNGRIDEAAPVDPCAVPSCDTCVPTSCGEARCASLPDGCGQRLTCPCEGGHP